MSREFMREVISVPLVADGNPSAALAAETLAKRECITSDLITLTRSAVLPQLMHQTVSGDHRQITKYTEESEERRMNLAARFGSRLMFREFTRKLDAKDQVRWNIVQEHQLLGANPEALRRYGIMATRLLVPDVFPKKSALLAAERFGSTITVWNEAAYSEVQNKGVKAELCRPFLYDGLHGTDDFDNSQQVVLKSSGSGMPRAWEDQIIGDLRRFDAEVDWRGYFPNRTYVPGGIQSAGSTYERISRTYRSLGKMTKLIIGQPSELIEVTAGMRAHNIPVWHVSLPPRGEHERRNLDFAHDHGLTLGVLNVAGAKDARLPKGCEIINLKDIIQNINELPQSKFNTAIIGSAGIWDVREESA